MMNNVNISGYLTDNAVLKHLNTPNQTSCLECSIGHTRTFTNQKGNIERETSFFEVVIYGGYAERIANKMTKGALIFVEGTLRQHKWRHEDRNYAKVVIIGKRVNIIGKTNQATNINNGANNEEKEHCEANHCENSTPPSNDQNKQQISNIIPI